MGKEISKKEEENSKIRKQPSQLSEIMLTLGLTMGLFGTAIGLEANLGGLPARENERVEDTSFNTYLERGKEQNGDNVRTYLFALWTYPGARLGAEINNFIALSLRFLVIRFLFCLLSSKE